MSLPMYVAYTDSIPVCFLGVLEDFCEKERYESFSVQRTFTADAFCKVRKGEKLACSDATTRFPRASCFKKPTLSVPETWGRMYGVLALRN